MVVDISIELFQNHSKNGTDMDRDRRHNIEMPPPLPLRRDRHNTKTQKRVV